MLSDQAILAIMQVLTVNRDLHDLLQSKGVSPEHVAALCSQAMEANRPSIRLWAVRRRGQLWRDAQGAPRVFESKSAASHEAKDAAPKVLAKGQGLIAERIIELAQQHGIHVHSDPDLVEVLSKIEIDQEIPKELYRAVAEVLAFVYRLNSTYVRT